MAYPTIDKTYGFKPINRLDGLPYAGAIRQIPVAAAYATAILNGDTVKVDTNGYVVAASTTDSGNIIGVLVGCSYINSMSQPVYGQAYPAAASTTTALAMAFVVDDPSAVFKVVAQSLRPPLLRLIPVRLLVLMWLWLLTLVPPPLVTRITALTVLPPTPPIRFPFVLLTLCPILRLACQP